VPEYSLQGKARSHESRVLLFYFNKKKYGGTGDEWAEAATFHSLGRPIDSMTS